jgi:long-chain acyl-CoA synthetase
MIEEQHIKTTILACSQPELLRPKLSYPSIAYDKLLTQSAMFWPEQVAIVYRNCALTFHELDALTNQFAHALQRLGVKQGERVCLFMTNRPEFVISCYAIARIGAVFSPINPSYKERELIHQLVDTEATAIVVQHELLPLVEAVRNQASVLKHVISVGPENLDAGPHHLSFADLLKAQPMTPPTVDVALSDLVALPFSSGTTGLSKGVMLTHRNRVCSTVQWASAMRVSEEDRFLIFLPLSHSMSAAAPLAPSVACTFRTLTGVRVLQAYGLTEVGPSHLNPIDNVELNVLESIGLPLSDTEQKVVDSEAGLKELAAGEVGELCIRSPQVMAGYWKAPEATACALRDGWFYTGDIGFIDARGYVFLQDRKKELIKYKGYSIAPAELEALLHEHPAVAAAAVIGIPDEEAGEVPKAFVVRKANSPDVSAEELVQFAADRLASYKTLREVAFIEAIPRSPTGKILRRVLKEQEVQKLNHE